MSGKEKELKNILWKGGFESAKKDEFVSYSIDKR